MLGDQKVTLDDLKQQMRDIDEETGLRDQQIAELDDTVKGKDCEL